MRLGKTLFSIQILVSKLLYYISFVNIFLVWKINFFDNSYSPSCIGSKFLWLNNHITIDDNSVYFKEFPSDNINFINKLLISELEFQDWKQNFDSPIIYITILHKFHTQFLKSGSKY